MIEIREATTTDMVRGLWRARLKLLAGAVAGLIIGSVAFVALGRGPQKYAAVSSVGIVPDAVERLPDRGISPADFLPKTTAAVMGNINARGTNYFLGREEPEMDITAAIAGDNEVQFRVVSTDARKAARVAGELAEGVVDHYRKAVTGALESMSAMLTQTLTELQGDLGRTSGAGESALVYDISRTRQQLGDVQAAQGSTNGGIIVINNGSIVKPVASIGPLVWAVGGALAGLLLAVFVVALATAFDRKVRSRADVEALIPGVAFVSGVSDGDRAGWTRSLLGAAVIGALPGSARGATPARVLLVPVAVADGVGELAEALATTIGEQGPSCTLVDLQGVAAPRNALPVRMAGPTGAEEPGPVAGSGGDGAVEIVLTDPLLESSAVALLAPLVDLVVLVAPWGERSFDEILLAADLLRGAPIGFGLLGVPEAELIRSGIPAHPVTSGSALS